MKKVLRACLRDNGGDAVVEAAILFPIMIMIFAGLVLLSMYLPQAANLERAVQYAATVLSLERSDTGYEFDEAAMTAGWNFVLHNSWALAFDGDPGNDVHNVYRQMLEKLNDSGDSYQLRAETIVNTIIANSITNTAAPVMVDCALRTALLYSEIEVTATQTIPIPIASSLSFIGFPTEIVIKRSALCMVKDGDGFLRDADAAAALTDIEARMADIQMFFHLS